MSDTPAQPQKPQTPASPSQNQQNHNGNGYQRHFRRRRAKRIPPPPGQRPDQDLVEEFLNQKGVTKCPSRFAFGSLKMTSLGFDN